MVFHLPNRFRIILALCISIIIASVSYIKINSKKKEDYEHTTGRLIYLDKEIANLPARDLGKYRYIKTDNYPYLFEIYADEQSARIDSLKTGDTVTAYYYETDNTKEERVNRFLQYLEKDKKIFFEKTKFQQQLGVFIIVLSIALLILVYKLWQKNKIPF